MARPLDRIRSIKVKLSVVIVAAVAVTAAMSTIGYQLGWPVWLRPLIAAGLALAMVQVLAHGMTRPLREMDRAAQALTEGNYGASVTSTGADEVARLAASFNAMAARLAEADRLRVDLLANVSHELRTPLAGLKATLENLADGIAEPTSDVLGAMITQTDRLGRLVADVLDLSRLEGGELALRPESVAISDLFDIALAEFGFEHPDVAVTTSVEPADLAVLADADRLHQVLANLLHNAARHGEGPIQLAGAATVDASAVELTVTDQGPGIPPAEVDAVFDRHYRTATGAAGGAGLGLAIARSIVELHDGSIEIGTAEPCGCRVTIRLPGDGGTR
ncbi:MAG: HAMP domain-containing histidine kinase [Acidimicrobiia bacterium]|nr:HAMP domain-containing histidine kinase [Acidimicrobiia bacterium]